jgi:hypothetical protein
MYLAIVSDLDSFSDHVLSIFSLPVLCDASTDLHSVIYPLIN